MVTVLKEQHDTEMKFIGREEREKSDQTKKGDWL